MSASHPEDPTADYLAFNVADAEVVGEAGQVTTSRYLLTLSRYRTRGLYRSRAFGEAPRIGRLRGAEVAG